MADETNIEWADSTFNPWIGCQKVGPGCDHCYAEEWNGRFDEGRNWGPGAPRRRTAPQNWSKPRRWQREAAEFYAKHKRRRRVFCASLADVFDNAVDPQWRCDLFDLIRECPDLDWLLLTKRIGNVAKLLAEIGIDELPANVWLGSTVVNQDEADRDVPKLLEVKKAFRASVAFLSLEPLLGGIDLAAIQYHPGFYVNCLAGVCVDETWPDPGRVDWIITGGESGKGARPLDPIWVQDIRDQCVQFDVAFLHKQWGEWLPGGQGNEHGLDLDRYDIALNDETVEIGYRVGKKLAGRKLDGAYYSGFPESSQ